MDNTNVQDTQQNVNPVDTAQAFETPAPVATEGSSNQFSIDDIILGQVDDTAPAFEPAVTPEATETPQPDGAPVGADDAKNDDNRYQYWQSRASKLENQMDTMRDQQHQLMTQQQAAQAPAQPEPVVEQFPDAPAKPGKPRHYSREEAYSDSTSESAKYLDDIEAWRDDMDEYSSIKHQYDLAVMQDKLDVEAKHRKGAEDAQRATQHQAKQVSEITGHVTQQYGMGPEEAQAFIQQMSKPDSLTMDNLVQLWRIQRGQGAPTNASVPAQPSAAFQQTQRAQQVPSPMGVMPGSSQASQGSAEDQIMDSMLTDFKGKNPWT
tara:strand:- start:63 stop:1025 length:963 start_codon:yes stop_codon:yes gene_type:complete